jgi:hypothetical protein
VYLAAQPEADLSELLMLEQPMLLVDEQTHALCKTLSDIYAQLAGEAQPLVQISQEAQEVSYPCILRAVKACLQAPWPQEEQWATLRFELLELYDDLLQEYAEALEQPVIRRPHTNSVMSRCKIITKDLMVNGTATIANLYAENIHATQQTVENLFVDSLNGVVHATNGLLSAGPVVNADLADNSVNANNLVDMSVIPSKLAFNSIQTNPAEPKLLLLYRGSVQADGTLLSGDGIKVAHPTTGHYGITFAAPYADPNYQVLVQVEDEIAAPFVQIVSVTPNGFTVNIANAGSMPVDAAFSFITLGTTP